MSRDLLSTYRRITGREPLIETPADFVDTRVKPPTLAIKLRLEMLKLVFPVDYARVDSLPFRGEERDRPSLKWKAWDIAVMSAAGATAWFLAHEPVWVFGAMAANNLNSRFLVKNAIQAISLRQTPKS